MKKEVTVCDECGIAKGESNRWFKVVIDRNNFCCIYPSSESAGNDFCGQECVNKVTGRWMESQK